MTKVTRRLRGRTALDSAVINGQNMDDIATELAALDGVTADATEINRLDGATTGAAVPSKAALYSPDGRLARASATKAAAGTVQGDATALTAEMNIVTGADGTAGVRLPAGTADHVVIVVNTGAQALKVYPATGAQINSAGANAPVNLGGERMAVFICRSTTQWYFDAVLPTTTATRDELQKLSGLTAETDELNALAFGKLRTDTTGTGTINTNRLISVDGAGDYVEADTNEANIVGINDEGAQVVDAAMFMGIYGNFTAVADGPIPYGARLKSCKAGRVGVLVDSSFANVTIDSDTGGNFANQPANDSVTIVSDSAGDTQTVSIYGTTNGGVTVVKEDIVLTGVTPVITVKADWGVILGIELSGNAVGTITFTETSGAQTITTITAGNASKGVVSVPVGDQPAYNVPPRAFADAGTTKVIGIVGTDGDYTASLKAVTLAGATVVDFPADMNKVTKLLVGDVESARTATVTIGAAEDQSRKIGKALGNAAATDDPIDILLSL